ncbi:MAG: hypothetical protein ACKVJT_08760 [Alphaproteobacteria bacterium]
MRLLVRHRLRRTRREGYVDRSEILDADEIRLGRGSDTELHLTDGRVLLHHATITLRDGVLEIAPDANGEIQQDGIPVPLATFDTAHTISVGPYDLTRLDDEEGCDAAIGIELTRPMGDAETDLRERLSTPLLGRRRTGWKLGGAVALVLLLLGVGVPLSTFFVSDDVAAPVSEAGTAELLRLAENLWVTDGVSRVHENLDRGCQACHTAPFAAVTNATCMDCHNTLTTHVDPHAKYNNKTKKNDCSACHQEHIGPDGMLPGVEITEAGCVTCHNGAINYADGSPLLKVASIAAHPPMTLPTPPASGLIFSHASHLVSEGMRSPEGGRKKLGCVDCHQSVNAGADMTLPGFESGCRSCHTLAFSPEDPTRRLPHGSVWKVQAEVDEFYAAVEAGDIKVTPLAAPERRRRPGARPRAIVKPAPLPAAARAEAALSGPAVKGQCQTCHVLDEGTNAAEWDIVPVDAIHDWLSSARFDHGDHEGEASCSSCHAVATSQSVEDVAMPSIGTCLECHGSASDFPDVDSTCASCHGFHGEPEQGASLEGHNGFATATTDTTPLARLAEILSDGKN